MKLLIGDIGGTKTVLQVVEKSENAYDVVYESYYSSKDHPDFTSLLKSFVGQVDPGTFKEIKSVCIGVAGPVENGSVKVTNLPWEIDSKKITSDSGIKRVTLINDFQAIAYGIEMLAENEMVALQQKKPARGGVRVILGAGTGLGECMAIWCDDHYATLASEGGHVAFAPTSDQQIELLRYLLESAKRVTYEDILSGPGLVRIFEFLCSRNREPPSQALTQAMRERDPAEVVSEFAMERRDMLACDALTLFVEIYGTHAGDLALTCMATGGVYIAGGIAPRIIKRLQQGDFMRAFIGDGVMSEILKKIPVRVVMNEKAGLLGAAYLAEKVAH